MEDLAQDERYSHEPNIATSRLWLKHLEMSEERRASLEAKPKLGYDALTVMEGHLEERDYFVAGRYTVADLALYAYTHVAGEGGFELERFANLRAWLERVAARPGHVPITQRDFAGVWRQPLYGTAAIRDGGPRVPRGCWRCR